MKEHHLQQAMSMGSAIPIPNIQNEVKNEFYTKICPPNYEMPLKMIQIPCNIIIHIIYVSIMIT